MGFKFPIMFYLYVILAFSALRPTNGQVDEGDLVDENQPPKKKPIPSKLMLKLKERLEDTEKFMNGIFRSSPIINSIQGDDDSFIETIHNSAINVQRYSQSDERENDLNELFETAVELIKSSKKSKQKDGYKLLDKATQLGHDRSKLKLAWDTIFGNLDRDFEEAKNTMMDLTKIGEPEAHLTVGFFYSAGIFEKVHQGRALVHFMISALGGNVWAQIVLGYRYKMGISVSLNCERSLQYYELAANKVVEHLTLTEGNLVQNVRLIDIEENRGYFNFFEADLMQYYEYMASRGDLSAQVTVGQLYYYGLRGCQKDIRKSEFYFTMAATKGSATALGYLGRIYLEGTDTINANYTVALDFFVKSAEKNSPVGFCGLGFMYLEGKGVEMDLKKAKRYFSSASDLGWIEGQLQLGVMLLNGIGTAKDYRAAFKYFHLAARGGHVLAYYHLAKMHSSGYGILRSCDSAVELYKSVAERGKSNEYLNYGYTKYQSGRRFDAFIIYSLLAEMGYEVAQSNSAYLMENGESGLKNVDSDEKYFRAFNYWKRAAQQGYSTANVKLGDYYYYGRGVPVDYEAAVNQYRLASSHFGNAQALFNIGYMHEKGLGVPRDLALAKRFYDLAAVVSQDAYFPVYLALIKVAFVTAFHYLSSKYPFTNFGLFNQLVLVPWDVFALAILFVALWFLISRRIA